MFTPISFNKNNTLSRFVSWLLMAFVSLTVTSCASTDGGIKPTVAPDNHETTLKVLKFKRSMRGIDPELPSDWFVSKGVYRERLFVQFNKPVDITTFNHITFKYTITSQDENLGAVMTGDFQYNLDKTIVGFESDKSLSEFLGRPVAPAEDFRHQLQLRGSHGPITDTDGNVWPFSGIYSQPDDGNPQGRPTLNNRPKSKLLDGDNDDQPGGSFQQAFDVIG